MTTQATLALPLILPSVSSSIAFRASRQLCGFFREAKDVAFILCTRQLGNCTMLDNSSSNIMPCFRVERVPLERQTAPRNEAYLSASISPAKMAASVSLL
jgi:hypothetical protein